MHQLKSSYIEKNQNLMCKKRWLPSLLFTIIGYQVSEWEWIHGEIFKRFGKCVYLLLIHVRRCALSCPFLWPPLLEALLKTKRRAKNSEVRFEDVAVKFRKSQETSQRKCPATVGGQLILSLKELKHKEEIIWTLCQASSIS